MVSDVTFYSVLGVSLFLIAVLGFMLYKMIKMFNNPIMGNVMTMLHTSLFAYESALINLLGSRGYRTHVFPQLVRTIKGFKDDSPYLEELYASKSIKEAMNVWLDLLHKAGIVKKGEIKHIEDSTYQISFPYCSFHSPIHDQMGDQNGICPMALILSAAATINNPDVEVEMQYSQFNPKGTLTTVKFIENQK